MISVKFPHEKSVIDDRYTDSYVKQADLLAFRDGLKSIFDYLIRHPDTIEESLKNDYISKFLKNIYGDKRYVGVPNETRARVDLQIHSSASEDSPISVIIETKRPDNPVEMISPYRR